MTPDPFDASLLAAGAVAAYPDGPLLRVTLDDPDRRNAQTPATWAALAHIGARMPEQTRVVLLSGAGSAFSAGMDRRMFAPQGIEGMPSLGDIVAAPAAAGAAIIEEFQRGFAWWRDSPAVTISVVQGFAVGAGFQLALATDLMVVAEDVQLVMKESSFGLVPDLTGTHPLVSALGYRRALEVCLTARPIGAAEAVATGLAVRSAPVGDLAAAAGELAAAIASLPPGTASATKQLLAGAPLRSPQEQWEAERISQLGRIRSLLGQIAR